MNPFEYYEEAQFGILTSVIHNDMNYYIDKFGDEGQDIVKLALEIAAYRGPEKTNWSYVKGILNNWLRTTHRTVEDIKAYEKQEATLRSNKAQSFRNNTSKEMTPGWINNQSEKAPMCNDTNELSDDDLEKEREKLRKELEESAREFEDKGGVRHHA
nr:DnaD domain protein [Macrococcus caseolyticus]